jgi:hypothetical protein
MKYKLSYPATVIRVSSRTLLSIALCAFSLQSCKQDLGMIIVRPIVAALGAANKGIGTEDQLQKADSALSKEGTTASGTEDQSQETDTASNEKGTTSSSAAAIDPTTSGAAMLDAATPPTGTQTEAASGGTTTTSNGSNTATAALTFIHPGLLYKKADLDRIKQEALSGEEPWNTAFQMLQPSTDYVASPVQNETIGTGQFQIRNDAAAASDLALKWYITGDISYARTAIKIIDDWSSTMQSFDPVDNLSASAAIGGFGNAAEILIYTGSSGWSKEAIDRYKAMIGNLLYPAVQKSKTDQMMGNQGIDAISAAMAVGIILDKPEYFNNGVDAWTNHPCVAVDKFILPTGQMGEAGRDQAHASFELITADAWARMAWNQGVDLYSTADNRLLKAYEYWSQYNLGVDVPFQVINLCNYGYHSISSIQRGRIAFIDIERAFDHYVTVKGLSAPYLTMATERMRSNTETLKYYTGPTLDDARIIADGTYRIITKLNGLAISVPNDNIVNGTQLSVEPYTARSSQKWEFKRIFGNIYSIVNAQNKSMDIPGSSVVTGTKIQTYQYSGNPNQLWRLVKNEDGSIAILNYYNSFGITITGGSNNMGARLQQASALVFPNPAAWQSWDIQPL